MKTLKLSNGLIAIGYGGTSADIDQTKFSLTLANNLAKKRKCIVS